MEKEKVLEIEITKINDNWNAITVKKIKEDIENNDLFEWVTVGGNYVCNDKIFINRVYPNIPFIARNETTFIFKGIVDKINKKYGITKRWRAEDFRKYYYINSVSDICASTEEKQNLDNERYELGNYFQTEEEAQKVIDSKEWQDFWEKVRAGEIGGDK